MSSGLLVALEIALVLVGVLGFGAWQLISLKREKARDALKAKEQAARQAGAHDGSSATGVTPAPQESKTAAAQGGPQS